MEDFPEEPHSSLSIICLDNNNVKEMTGSERQVCL